jgi:signal transduction histidine kinase
MTDQSGRKHLLIVDDEPVILQILEAVFEDEPMRLTCVTTGADAARVLDEQGCDLLITDKNLPDINGLELLKKAKAIDPFCEVIVITGYASLETALTAMEFDAFDYVVKPLNNVFDIRKKARRALEKRALALENQRLLTALAEHNAALESALADAGALQAELIQAGKLAGIGTLAAGIAHEVSSPLFGILGLAEAIPDEDDRTKVDAYAAEIAVYSQSIRDIVVDLSSYSRTTADQDVAPIDLSTVIKEACTLVGRGSDLTGLELDLNLAEGLSIRAQGTEIRQVFVNLVKNALESVRDEHTNGGGQVKVTSGRGIDCLWAEIFDNGVGIPEEVRGQVFDPFYTTKPPGKGTGLGLNVVYRIVTKHRGTISVQAGEEGGTVFRLQFPTIG